MNPLPPISRMRMRPRGTAAAARQPLSGVRVLPLPDSPPTRVLEAERVPPAIERPAIEPQHRVARHALRHGHTRRERVDNGAATGGIDARDEVPQRHRVARTRVLQHVLERRFRLRRIAAVVDFVERILKRLLRIVVPRRARTFARHRTARCARRHERLAPLELEPAPPGRPGAPAALRAAPYGATPPPARTTRAPGTRTRPIRTARSANRGRAKV